MKTKSAKAKGNRLAQKLVDKILECNKDLTTDDVRRAMSSETGEDIKLSTAARKKFPFSVEAKNWEKLRISQFWKIVEQAEKNCPENQAPLVLLGKNRTEPWVCMKMDDFFEMLKNLKINE